MRALLLAAGLGTRLRPLTDRTPKCLVDVNGRPLLGHWLDALFEARVEPILVNTHHLSAKVEAFLKGRVDRAKIHAVHEELLLGTAGTVRENSDFFKGERGLVIHADNFCTANFSNLVDAHNQRPPDTLITMMTFVSDAPSTCGIVELDQTGRVTGFHEKVANPPGNLANGAIYIFEPEVIDFIRQSGGSVTDISNDVLPRFLGKIFTWPTDGHLVDVGTLENLEKARRLAAML